jgi:hypothetical protein
MTKCPTGFTKNGEPSRTCDRDGDIGDIISSINFADSLTQWPFVADYNGRYEGPILIGKNPVLLPNRGLYLDGNDDFMRLYDVRLNFQMTIHCWINVFSETGHVFSLETSVPNSQNIFDNELAVKFDVENGAQKIYGVWDATVSAPGDGSGFMKTWTILHFRFEDD